MGNDKGIFSAILAMLAYGAGYDNPRRYMNTTNARMGWRKNTRGLRSKCRKHCHHDKVVAAKRQQRESRRINRIAA